MPETSKPTLQAKKIRTRKKAAKATPSAQRLKPKNAMAMSVTGTTRTASLMRLITIKAPTNSAVGAVARPRLFEKSEGKVGGSLPATFSEIPTLVSTSPANGRNTARRGGSYLVASLTIAAATFI
jgi:hypothetical protein